MTDHVDAWIQSHNHHVHQILNELIQSTRVHHTDSRHSYQEWLNKALSWHYCHCCYTHLLTCSPFAQGRKAWLSLVPGIFRASRSLSLSAWPCTETSSWLTQIKFDGWDVLLAPLKQLSRCQKKARSGGLQACTSNFTFHCPTDTIAGTLSMGCRKEVPFLGQEKTMLFFPVQMDCRLADVCSSSDSSVEKVPCSVTPGSYVVCLYDGLWWIGSIL